MIFDEEHCYQITLIASITIFTIIGLVLLLRLSMWIRPSNGNNFWSSKPVTGWSNLQPKKMALYNTIDVVSGKINPNKNDTFKGI